MTSIGNIPDVSVIVAAYNEAESLPELCERLNRAATQSKRSYSLEITIVDDGSTDKTPEVLAKLADTTPNLLPIRLRRNSGKSIALMAGLRSARGQRIVTVDADLQDRPEDIGILLRKLDEGFDVVVGWRRNRVETLSRRFGSLVFNYVVKRTTGLMLHDLNCGLKAMTRDAASRLCIYGHHHRYLPLHAYLAGYKVTEAPVHNDARKYGLSKYVTFRYQGLFDLLTILFNEKYGLNPMHFFGVVSFIIAVPSVAVLLWLVSEQMIYWTTGAGFQVYNRPILAFSLTAMILSFVIFMTGFVCDFFLHHRIRGRIDEIIELITDNSGAIEKLPRICYKSNDQSDDGTLRGGADCFGRGHDDEPVSN